MSLVLAYTQVRNFNPGYESRQLSQGIQYDVGEPGLGVQLWDHPQSLASSPVHLPSAQVS